jgi:hypothetical protein
MRSNYTNVTNASTDPRLILNVSDRCISLGMDPGHAAPLTSPSERTSRSSSSSSSSTGSSSTSSSSGSSATGTDMSTPIPECAARNNCCAPTEFKLANSSHHCWGCNKKIHSALLCGSSMSDLIVNNPSAVSISLHNGNIIAVGDDNETRAICFRCLGPLSVFFSGTVATASTESVASDTEVQEQVSSIVEIQQAVTSNVVVQDVNDN